MLSIFANIQLVGHLGAASSLANILGPLQAGIYALMLPTIADERKKYGLENMKKTLFHGMLMLSIFYLLWLIITFFVGEKIVTLFYSNKYTNTGYILFLLVLGSFFAGISVPITACFEALERPDLSLKSQLLGIVVTVIVGVPLVYYFSLVGVAISITVSSVVMFSARAIYVRSILTKEAIQY